ncbi:LPD1 domain-containing protein [Psychrobacter celer]|uniref:LPD1 domain-containing protein n=1 Tax=Psychrobacter celer TaxID=306572 RepID=UPI003FD148B7
MKDDGGDAGTAFIIQKVFASIAPYPHWDIEYFVKNSQGGRRLIRSKDTESKVAFYEELGNYSTSDQKRAARSAYVNGINTLKSRISNIKDTRLLVSELKAIAGEMVGAKIGAEATDDYNASQSESDKIKVLIKDDFKRYVADYEDAKNKAKKEIELESGKNLDKAHLVFVDPETGFKVQKRDNDFWKTTRAIKRWLEYKNPSEEFVVIGGSSVSTLAPLVTRNYVDKLNEITKKTNKQKLTSSLDAFKDENANLAWISLGERFWGIIELTSGAFVKHANMSLNKRYDDWALVIKEDDKSDATTKKPAKKKQTFELIVADKIERKGGRPIAIKSTKELKDNFGFRDIQSGDWVLKDKNSAQFHVENAAAAMMDLSDIVGIDEKSLAFGGRLALALGARGRSGAKAHYEPVQRVINITKMKGGGSLGHEWFHAIDNILGEVLNIDGATGANVFLSSDSSALGDTPLNSAFNELRNVMTLGNVRSPEVFKITQKDIDLATSNMKEDARNSMITDLMNSNATDAVISVDERFGSVRNSKRNKNHTNWRRMAVAYYNQDKLGQEVVLNTGELVSSFYAESKRLDAGKSKPYWSSTLEMAARAFQAFLEDSLKDQDRRNDYLSYGADNSLYGGSHQAYPEGEERKRINAVFKRLFATIKDQKVFENAAANTAMMDSIFGATILLDTQGD